jgi:glucokinase
MTSKTVVGIDLGGTKISTGLVNEQGELVLHDYRETAAEEGPDAVIEQMVNAARQVIDHADVDREQVMAVGVGAPGPLDIGAGLVISPPNLPGWDRVPLCERIAEALALPTFLENDANAAALGEHRFGAGRDTTPMIYVTVSTGIGGGLILDGRIYHGASGAAGEVGHQTILPNGPLCGCGNRGCLEVLASGTAVARVARERARRGVPTRIVELVDGDLEAISARVVAQAAAEGDREAEAILSEALNYLGIGMANVVNMFNPELIVIGGGLTKVGEPLFEAVRRGIIRHALPAPREGVRVTAAELGDHVGVIGAGAVALQAMG